MFFSYQILIRKNGNFAVIWRYMHGPRGGHSKVSKKELLGIDIGQACTDLKNYVPTGRLDKFELQTKMSLYLLAQLSYGVTLVLNVQADYLISDLQSLLNTMAYVPAEKPQKKRKAAEAATAGMEQEDLEDAQFETPRTRKKRRTTQSTRQSLLDLSDPRSYVDQQVPIHHKADQEANGLQELHEDFMDTTAGEVLPPLEWNALIDEQPKEPHPQKVSVASLRQDFIDDDSIRDLERSLGVTTAEGERDETLTTGHLEERRDGERRETIDDFFGPELPMDDTRGPIYRQSLNQTEETSFVQEFDEIRLDALPDLEMPPPTAVPRRRRRVGGIIFDEQTQLTDEQIQQQINNIRGIVRGNEEFRRMFFCEKEPPLSQLLDPFPGEYLDKQFRSLFECVTKNYRERPITFQEAQHLTYEELRERRFDVEIASWRCDSNSLQGDGNLTNGSTLQQPPQKVSVASLVLPPEDTLEGSSNLKRPSTPMEIEVSRRAMQESISDRQSMMIPLEDSMQQSFQFDQSIEQMRDARFGDDIRLERESLLVKASPDVPEEDWIDNEMDQLYNNIVNKLEDQVVVYFHNVANVNQLGDKEIGRKRAARKFFTLLKLLKHRKIKVRQIEPYGPIMIRLMKGDLDISIASSFA